VVVLTVDDHPLIRSALREVVGMMSGPVELLEASDPPEGLEVLKRRPDTDLVFLDLSFRQHDGLAFVQSFRAAAPAAPLVIYTMHEDARTLREALARGAVGIVPKTHSAKLLQRAIDLVMSGGVYVSPELARQLASPEAETPPPQQPLALSEQQWKILELLVQGSSNKAIARTLGVAPSTVKNQLTVLFGKLGVTNRTQAAIAARALLESKPPGA
jgi:DNA-binding NarL/FixJ family response regulator